MYPLAIVLSFFSQFSPLLSFSSLSLSSELIHSLFNLMFLFLFHVTACASSASFLFPSFFLAFQHSGDEYLSHLSAVLLGLQWPQPAIQQFCLFLKGSASSTPRQPISRDLAKAKSMLLVRLATIHLASSCVCSSACRFFQEVTKVK